MSPSGFVHVPVHFQMAHEADGDIGLHLYRSGRFKLNRSVVRV